MTNQTTQPDAPDPDATPAQAGTAHQVDPTNHASTPSPASKPSALGRDAGISAGVAAVFLLLRLLAVSHWDWHTAEAVVDTIDFGDALSIVLGTLFARPGLTGLLIMLLLPIAVINLVWPPFGISRWSVGQLLTVAALLAGAAALITTEQQIWLPLGALAVAAVIVGIRLLWRHGTAQDLVQTLLRRAGVLGLGGFLVLAAVVDTPWIPLEKITTTTGVISGYVMDAEPGFLKVLTDGDRELMILKDGEVTSRMVDP